MKYLVKFDRIGRSHTPHEKVFEVDGTPEEMAQQLAELIFSYCRKFLASAWYEVHVYLDDMRGSIEYGRFGEFTLTEIK